MSPSGWTPLTGKWLRRGAIAALAYACLLLALFTAPPEGCAFLVLGCATFLSLTSDRWGAGLALGLFLATYVVALAAGAVPAGIALGTVLLAWASAKPSSW